jgi:RimJ/RimL family protein N-acetyltransferase
MGAGPSDDVPVFLETERLVLRRFTADDADDLLALDLDPLVRRYVEDGEPVTHEEAVSSIEHFLRYHERSEHFGFWVAVETESARFLGWFHFRPSPDDPPLEPELGYRWCRRRGAAGSRRKGHVR